MQNPPVHVLIKKTRHQHPLIYNLLNAKHWTICTRRILQHWNRDVSITSDVMQLLWRFWEQHLNSEVIACILWRHSARCLCRCSHHAHLYFFSSYLLIKYLTKPMKQHVEERGNFPESRYLIDRSAPLILVHSGQVAAGASASVLTIWRASKGADLSIKQWRRKVAPRFWLRRTRCFIGLIID